MEINNIRVSNNIRSHAFHQRKHGDKGANEQGSKTATGRVQYWVNKLWDVYNDPDTYKRQNKIDKITAKIKKLTGLGK